MSIMAICMFVKLRVSRLMMASVAPSRSAVAAVVVIITTDCYWNATQNEELKLKLGFTQ